MPQQPDKPPIPGKKPHLGNIKMTIPQIPLQSKIKEPQPAASHPLPAFPKHFLSRLLPQPHPLSIIQVTQNNRTPFQNSAQLYPRAKEISGSICAHGHIRAIVLVNHYARAYIPSKTKAANGPHTTRLQSARPVLRPQIGIQAFLSNIGANANPV